MGNGLAQPIRLAVPVGLCEVHITFASALFLERMGKCQFRLARAVCPLERVSLKDRNSHAKVMRIQEQFPDYYMGMMLVGVRNVLLI